MPAANFAPSRFAVVVSTAARLVAKLRQAGEHRRALRSLASLDDHMLRDIGLTRFDVDAALVEPALTDGTLILAERAREARQNQRAAVRDARTGLAFDADFRRAA